MLKVLIDNSPLKGGHARRGIGMYTRLLMAELAQHSQIQIVAPSDAKNIKPDVIHYPFFDLFFATLPISHSTPAVVTIHDVIPLLFPKYYPPGVKGKLKFFKQKIALRTVSQIITDSEASKQDIVKHLKIKPEKVNVIYLAAHPELVPPTPSQMSAARTKFDLPAKYLLYVGDINYNKNIPQLIKALKYLPEDIHLVCVGANFRPQPIAEWQWITTQMALSDVEDRVHFITDLATDQLNDLAAIYTQATAYVQPSLAEGFGLPVLEAMTCQTPVVAAHNSSLIEVGGEVVEYCEPTAESIAQQVKKISDWSSNMRKQKVMAAQAWSKKFTWAKTATQTIKVYQKAVGL